MVTSEIDILNRRRFGNASARGKIGIDRALNDFQKEKSMVPLSVLGGLFVVAYCISLMKTKRAAKPDVQTLFGKK